MTEYKNPSKISRNEAIRIFSGGSTNEVCDALLAVAFYDKDWKWVQTQCLHFLNDADPDVRGLAATCLGHIARIHHKLERKLVVEALKSRFKDAKISEQIQDALDDIEMFLRI
jgi:hypothetical protein